jgi:nucleoside-diphosphate-sugar epimerase
MKKNVLITGCSGYVGAMLVDQLLKNNEVGVVVGIDKMALEELVMDESNLKLREEKLVFINKNLGDKSWMGEAIHKLSKKLEQNNGSENKTFDIVIHTAWQIREMYGQKNLQWEWNVGGSDNVFDFVFQNKIKKLVHFSTVASYGAYPENTINHHYKEDERFRKTDYLYAEEKRITEEHLEERYRNAIKNNYDGQVVIIRPAAISGPRGRFGRIRFGLQSALSGTLKGEKSIAYTIVGAMTRFTPVTEKWLRQFVHEDDIVDLVIKCAINKMPKNYEAFNVCPLGESVMGEDMARAVGKKPIRLNPLFIRFVFFWMWHLSHGKIPTSRGSWKSYSYPIAVDGSRIAQVFDYKYKASCLDAFTKNEGRYASRYLR